MPVINDNVFIVGNNDMYRSFQILNNFFLNIRKRNWKCNLDMLIM